MIDDEQCNVVASLEEDCPDDGSDAGGKYTLVKVPVEAIEALRDAIAGAKGSDVRISQKPITLAWAISRGLSLVRTELEVHHNDGVRYEPRTAPLQRGRPWPSK